MAGARPGPAPALLPIHDSRRTRCRTVPHPEVSGLSSRTPAPQRDSGEREPPGASRPGSPDSRLLRGDRALGARCGGCGPGPAPCVAAWAQPAGARTRGDQKSPGAGRLAGNF